MEGIETLCWRWIVVREISQNLLFFIPFKCAFGQFFLVQIYEIYLNFKPTWELYFGGISTIYANPIKFFSLIIKPAKMISEFLNLQDLFDYFTYLSSDGKSSEKVVHISVCQFLFFHQIENSLISVDFSFLGNPSSIISKQDLNRDWLQDSNPTKNAHNNPSGISLLCVFSYLLWFFILFLISLPYIFYDLNIICILIKIYAKLFQDK